MASSLTYLGQKYALYGDGSADGSIVRKAAYLRLYRTAPTVLGGAVEASGGGYAAKAITPSDWVANAVPGPGNPMFVRLADRTWTATGSLTGVAGAYLTDSSGGVLAWWERSAGVVDMAATDTLTTYQLTIRFP